MPQSVPHMSSEPQFHPGTAGHSGFGIRGMYSCLLQASKAC